jgi:hypothetical protein
VIFRSPKSDFLRLMIKKSHCYVLDSMLKLSKILEKDNLFSWKYLARLSQEI